VFTVYCQWFFLLKALEGVVRAFDTYYRQLNYLLTYKLLVESRRHNVTQCGRRATQRPARRTRASINYSTTEPGRAGPGGRSRQATGARTGARCRLTVGRDERDPRRRPDRSARPFSVRRGPSPDHPPRCLYTTLKITDRPTDCAQQRRRSILFYSEKLVGCDCMRGIEQTTHSVMAAAAGIWMVLVHHSVIPMHWRNSI